MKTEVRNGCKKGYYDISNSSSVNVDFYDDKSHKIGCMKESSLRVKFEIRNEKSQKIGVAVYTKYSELELNDSSNRRLKKLDKCSDILTKDVMIQIFESYFWNN